MAGYAFIPYTPYDGNYEHRPNKGVMVDLKNGAAHEIKGDDDSPTGPKAIVTTCKKFQCPRQTRRHRCTLAQGGGVLNNLIVDLMQPTQGIPVYSPIKPCQWQRHSTIPNREVANYRLKYGNLDSGLAGKYQEVNTNNSVWSDQTEVFGSTQQSWKAAKDFWGNTFGYIPVVGNAGNIFSAPMTRSMA